MYMVMKSMVWSENVFRKIMGHITWSFMIILKKSCYQVAVLNAFKFQFCNSKNISLKNCRTKFAYTCWSDSRLWLHQIRTKWTECKFRVLQGPSGSFRVLQGPSGYFRVLQGTSASFYKALLTYWIYRIQPKACSWLVLRELARL